MTLVRKFNNQMPGFNNLLDDFLGKDFYLSNGSNDKNTMPFINVKENDNEYIIEVAAPGLKKENFNIEVENNVLTISYDLKEEKEESDKGFISREFHYNSFKKSFSIPKNEVDDSKIEASYDNGILKVNLKKREEIKPKPARVIEIN